MNENWNLDDLKSRVDVLKDRQEYLSDELNKVKSSIDITINKQSRKWDNSSVVALLALLFSILSGVYTLINSWSQDVKADRDRMINLTQQINKEIVDSSRSPDDQYLQSMVAQDLMVLGLQGAAILQRTSGSPIQYSIVAQALFSGGQWTQALDVLRDGLRYSNNHFDKIKLLSVELTVLYALGDYDQAENVRDNILYIIDNSNMPAMQRIIEKVMTVALVIQSNLRARDIEQAFENLMYIITLIGAVNDQIEQGRLLFISDEIGEEIARIYLSESIKSQKVNAVDAIILIEKAQQALNIGNYVGVVRPIRFQRFEIMINSINAFLNIAYQEIDIVKRKLSLKKAAELILYLNNNCTADEEVRQIKIVGNRYAELVSKI